MIQGELHKRMKFSGLVPESKMPKSGISTTGIRLVIPRGRHSEKGVRMD